MIRFSSEQLLSFGALARESFVRQMVVDLALCFADFDALAAAERHRVVSDGVDQAATYGIASERHVAQYLGLMAEWGDQFAELPEVQVFLADGGLTASRKLVLVELQLESVGHSGR